MDRAVLVPSFFINSRHVVSFLKSQNILTNNNKKFNYNVHFLIFTSNFYMDSSRRGGSLLIDFKETFLWLDKMWGRLLPPPPMLRVLIYNCKNRHFIDLINPTNFLLIYLRLLMGRQSNSAEFPHLLISCVQ